jgi:hypothetical protein
MAGEWIEEKARGLLGMFPGQWEAVGGDTYQGRCPGEDLHTGGSAATDCRIYLTYGAGGQTPGVYCLHRSCKGILDDLNEKFRTALFERSEGGARRPVGLNEGVVLRAPREREGWIPEFNLGKLRGTVKAMPEVTAEWFMERSPVNVTTVGPADFLDQLFAAGERVMVFTEFKGPGDYLWEAGRGGYRLAPKREVQAIGSKLPVDGGRDGVWFLSNPVDGSWYANPRRQGAYSRRSMESVTCWKHLLLECDEEKTLLAQARALQEAARLLKDGAPKKKFEEVLAATKRPKWAELMMQNPAAFEEQAVAHQAQAVEVPGLWMRLLAMMPLEIRAIYSSGGYSLHALWGVNMPSKAEFDTFLREHAKRVLPLVGADPAAMTPVRLTRLPGCLRGGKMQRLIYLNPGADGTPIRDMPKLRKIQREVMAQ